MVFKSIAVGAIVALGIASVSNAAILPTPTDVAATAIVKVAEGCGPGWWRGPHGVCHPGGWGGAGYWRACPPGMHLGPYGHRCWAD
jgi:hypothetical protein